VPHRPFSELRDKMLTKMSPEARQRHEERVRKMLERRNKQQSKRRKKKAR